MFDGAGVWCFLLKFFFSLLFKWDLMAREFEGFEGVCLFIVGFGHVVEFVVT